MKLKHILSMAALGAAFLVTPACNSGGGGGGGGKKDAATDAAGEDNGTEDPNQFSYVFKTAKKCLVYKQGEAVSSWYWNYNLTPSGTYRGECPVAYLSPSTSGSYTYKVLGDNMMEINMVGHYVSPASMNGTVETVTMRLNFYSSTRATGTWEHYSGSSGKSTTQYVEIVLE